MDFLNVFIWGVFFFILLLIVLIASKDVIVWAFNLVSNYIYERNLRLRGVDFSMDLSTKYQFNQPPYIRSPYSHVFQVLTKLKFDSGLNFVDCGSGKGNILYDVRSFNFNILGGIELNKSLHDIAVENLNILLPNRYVELINKPVLDCCDELDCFNVFYCYGLFNIDTLYEFVSNLCDSYKRNSRPIWVVYTNLVSRKPFIEHNFKEIYFFSRSSICDFQTVVFKYSF